MEQQQTISEGASYRGRRVLVTGADGFIGSHLVEALAADGALVTAFSLYNSFDSFGWLDDLGDETLASIKRVRVDIRDAGFMRRALADQDIVFHLAALIAIPHSYVAPQSYVETNILGTLNILDAAHVNGVQRVVHTSTSEVYGSAVTLPISEDHPLQGQSPYSASKIGADMLAESYVRSFDAPVVILRPFNSYGPRQSERAIIPTLIRQFLDSSCRVVKVGDVTTTRDFTFVTDTVAAFMAAGIGSRVAFGRPYNAGSGKMISVGGLIEVLAQVIGTTKPVLQEQERMRPGNSEVRALQADSRRMFGDTGWQPRASLQQGLMRTTDWWRKRLQHGQVRRHSGYMS
jgi:NAD dependent epimerase/dehydratase